MRDAKPGEELLTDLNEKWLRPTSPAFVVDREHVGFEAFRLRKEDNGELSGARSSKQHPEQAEKARLERRLSHGALATTGGTYGINVAQLQEMDLQCFDDTLVIEKQPLPTGHAFVDLASVPKDQLKNKYRELAEAANLNGVLSKLSEQDIAAMRRDGYSLEIEASDGQ